ncbi:MAG: hypothetical protein V7749_00485 [Cocleimonas sp.]
MMKIKIPKNVELIQTPIAILDDEILACCCKSNSSIVTKQL